MSDAFDPYYTWLGIPPAEQPADYYRLLGVKPLEENLDAIENAADRQMAHLRTLQSGKHSTLSQKLLNEVAAAKVTLLNLTKKTEYDQSLRQKLKPKAAPKDRAAKATLPMADPLSDDAIPRPDFVKEPPQKTPNTARKQQAVTGAAIGGGVFVLLLIAFLVWRASGPNETSPDELAAGDGSAVGQPGELHAPPPPAEAPSETPPGGNPVAPGVPETPPEPALSLADVPWTNVLEHVNLTSNAGGPGSWTQDGGELTLTGGTSKGLVLPVHIEGQYDLQMELTRNVGDDPVIVHLPVGNRCCTLRLGMRWRKDRCALMGMSAGPEFSEKGASLGVGASRRLDVTVRLEADIASIETLLDGQRAVAWAGNVTELAAPTASPNRLRLAGGVGRGGNITTNSSVTFHTLRIRSTQETPVVATTEPEEPVIGTPGEAVAQAPVETPVVEPPKPVKHPVPPPEEQKRILAALEELYGLSKAKTAEEKIKLAKELLELGGDPSGIPAERFVTLRKAMDLAREAGDARLMLAAVDAMGTANIDVNLLDAKGTVFAQFAETAKDPAVIKSLMENLPPLVEAAVAEKRYDVAYNAVKAAHKASARPTGLAYRKELSDKLKEMEGLRRELAAVQQAEASLQTNPDDPAANLLVGRWYCFDKGNWDRGLPFLAKGSDAQLSQAASKELTPPADPEAMVALGDIWWGMAEKAPEDQKKTLYARAGHWYGKTEGKLTGALAKLKVEKRLGELAKIDPKMAAEMGVVKPGSPLPVGRWIDLLQFVPADKGWQREGDALVLREVREGTRTFPVVFKGDYDLQVDYTRYSGSYPVNVALPIGERVCELGLDYQGTSGLGRIDGERWYRNSTSQKHAWELGKKYSILSKVRMTGENVTIDVLRDGQPLVNWSGKPASLEAHQPREQGDPNTPHLKFYKTDGTLHAARTRLVSGNGGLLDAEGKIPAEVLAAGTGKPGTAIDPLSFVPGGGAKQNEKGAWELTEREHQLRLAKPVEGPWILDFDFVLPKNEQGLTVAFGEQGRLTLTILANYHCAIRWRGGEGSYLAKLPREGTRLLQPGKAFHARLMVGPGGAALLINNVPALQATDKRITPNGSITITGRPAVIANPKLTVKPGKPVKPGLEPHKQAIPKPNKNAIRRPHKKK